MSGRTVSRLYIRLALLLLFLLQFMTSNCTYIEPTLDNRQKVDIHNLYSAYRERLMEHQVALDSAIHSIAAVSEESDKDSKLKVSTKEIINKNVRHSVDKGTLKKENANVKISPGSEKSEFGFVYPKTTQQQGVSGDQSITCLKNIYKEFTNTFHKPLLNLKKPNFLNTQPIRLSALNDLMNVVEHLKLPNTVDDIVNAISDQMSEEAEDVTPFFPNSKEQHQVKDSLKRVMRTVKKKPDIVQEGLYDVYKKKLDEILMTHKKFPKPDSKSRPVIFEDATCHAVRSMSKCQCDVKRTPTLGEHNMASEWIPCHCDASSYAVECDLRKGTQGLLECHCDAGNMDSKTGQVNTLKAVREKNTMGGSKTNFISISKERQLASNEKHQAKKQQLSLPVKETEVTHNSPKLQRHNHQELRQLLKVLQVKRKLPLVRRCYKRALLHATAANTGNRYGSISFPQVLVNPVGQGQQTGGVRMIDSLARQWNVSPTEMAQHIADSSTNAANSASQISGPASQGPKATLEAGATQQAQLNIGPILEKILSRLQTMQDNNIQLDAERLPCCFAEPTEGAPCELTGSWESLLMGVRINIAADSDYQHNAPKPVCAQPRNRRSTSQRYTRQCAKLTPAEINERYKSGDLKQLNVSFEETMPPRPHEMMENLTDWQITGHAVSTLGGPVSFSCRKLDSKLMASFIGFCRNCGCIDTIFGSWTFCQPSRDCQDITMSIFDRRDVLRRYSLPEVRKERIKEHLYTKSKFSKLEKMHQQKQRSHSRKS